MMSEHGSFPVSSSPHEPPRGTEELLELLHTRSSLITQIQHLQASIIIAKDHSTIVPVDALLLEDLQNQYIEVKSEQHNKELQVQCLQTGNALHDVVGDNTNPQNSALIELLQTQHQLSSEILTIMKENSSLNKEYSELQSSITGLQNENRDLTKNMLLMKNNQKQNHHSMQKSGTPNKLQRMLATKQDHIVLIQEVFKSLIAASRLNWAANEKLCKLVYQLNVPVTDLLDDND